MYVDIDRIKKEVTMVMLLEYYGIKLRQSGQNGLVGTCPLHHGDNPMAFRVDRKKISFIVLPTAAAVRLSILS